MGYKFLTAISSYPLLRNVGDFTLINRKVADQLKIDPIELRLKYLDRNSRPAVVIRKVAKESAWQTGLPKGHYHGFAYQL